MKSVGSSNPFSGSRCPVELSSTRPRINEDTIAVNLEAGFYLTAFIPFIIKLSVFSILYSLLFLFK